MNDIEKLAVAQAVYKVVAQAVSTKNPESLRSVVDGELLEDYAERGIKSRDVFLMGEKVGTMTVKTGKERNAVSYEVVSTESVRSWLAENSDAAIAFAMSQPVDFAQWHVMETGEIPDGIETREFTVPAGPSGTALKIDVDEVAKAMGGELPNAVAGLLGGGE